MTSADILNKSLFICYSTPNYSKLTELCLKSLTDIGVKNIEHLLDYPDQSLMEKTGFQSDLWYYSTNQKMVHLVNSLKKYKSNTEYKYFVLCDCDIIFIKKNIAEWQNLEIILRNDTNKDIFYMKEYASDVNTGFVIIKNNENIDNIIHFYEEAIHLFQNSSKLTNKYGDQSVVNRIKHKIRYGFIPNEYVIWGEKIYNKHKSLFHHAVCCKDVDDKIVQINKIQSAF